VGTRGGEDGEQLVRRNAERILTGQRLKVSTKYKGACAGEKERSAEKKRPSALTITNIGPCVWMWGSILQWTITTPVMPTP
jgi:hypothetical protein